MNPRRLAVAVSLSLIMLLDRAGVASAAQLFSADFQDGKTTGWDALGVGDVRLTTYDKNISLRLAAGATAVTTFSAARYRQVVVTLAFAAEHLGATGACIADLSVDRGHTWIEAARLNSGEDDGVTLRRNGALLSALADSDHVILRVRNAATNSKAFCWVDDILVEATPMLAGEHLVARAEGRTILTAPVLQSASSTGPWPMTEFSVPEDARPAVHRFEGRLQWQATSGEAFHVLVDKYDYATANGKAATQLPAFDFEFVQSADALIPARRGAIPSEHPAWEFILGPGRVWNETADGDYSRASLPFTLEERGANCMHNGVLTFLFSSDGSISNVAYEIGKETCSYFQFDAWGFATARYLPGQVADREAVLARFQLQNAQRLPSRPIAALAIDYPVADPNRFGSPAEVPAASMTVYGLVADGRHYTASCETRFGTYPFCDQLALPSYSLAKTLVGTLTSLRFAQLYPGIMNERIATFVPECKASAGWDQVTFENVLDMTTGHYRSTGFEVDEDAPDSTAFFLAEDHAGKIGFACTHYPNSSAPGNTWVYHTSDSYLLGTALNGYYRAKQGVNADFFDNIWVPQFAEALHLSPEVAVTRRSRDAAREPFTGYGLTLLRDDVAKLAEFIQASPKQPAAAPGLDLKLLAEALQLDPSNRGSVTLKDLRYQHGIWAWNAQGTLGCQGPTWIPFLSGYGGITVALMPNGFDYYYFSDGGALSWVRAAMEADRIRPFCAKKQ
jgi:Beta-lactamase